MSDQRLVGRSTCSSLVITCSDFRFKSAERAFVDTAGLRDDHDLIARPGAIRSLVQPRSAGARESLEQEIVLLWKVHNFTRVLMLNHLSCRAYDDIASPATERAAHVRHLLAAAPIIEGLVEAVTAEAYLIEPDKGRLVCRRIPMEASSAP